MILRGSLFFSTLMNDCPYTCILFMPSPPEASYPLYLTYLQCFLLYTKQEYCMNTAIDSLMTTPLSQK